MGNKLLIGTRNAGKVTEIASLLEDLDIEVVSLDGFPQVPDVDEVGRSFEENAELKALAYAKATGLPAIADDSGLEVDALDGRPGVYSARYSGPDINPMRNNQKLLEELAEHGGSRHARFVCAIACAVPGKVVFTTRGTVDGTILTEPRGTGGFGYDPLFFSHELGKSFGEAGRDEKATVSHRGKALRLFRARLLRDKDSILAGVPPDDARRRDAQARRSPVEDPAEDGQPTEGAHGMILVAERMATCVFSDIAGYSHHTQGWSGRDQLFFLNRYFDLIGPIIEDYGGVIDNVMGDGLFFHFNAAEPVDEHARAAVAAVGEVLDAIDDYEDRTGDISYRTRFGINTGFVTLGHLGPKGQRMLTPIGVNVSIAALLVDRATKTDTGVCFGLETARLTKDLVETALVDTDLPPFDDVEVYAVTRWKDD